MAATRPKVLPTVASPGEEIYAEVRKDQKGSSSTATPVSDPTADLDTANPPEVGSFGAQYSFII